MFHDKTDTYLTVVRRHRKIPMYFSGIKIDYVIDILKTVVNSLPHTN